MLQSGHGFSVGNGLKNEAIIYLVQHFEPPVAVKVFAVCAYGPDVQTHSYLT